MKSIIWALPRSFSKSSGGTEGINLTSCDDFEGVSYLLYHPSCPWNRSDTDRRPIGCRSLASFLVRRKAPKHRKHIRQLLEQYGCDGFEGFLQVTYALSLNDTFWIRRAGSSLNWRQISLTRTRSTRSSLRRLLTARGLLTDDIRRDLNRLEDFTFRQHPRIHAEQERLGSLSKIVQNQIHQILSA